MHNKTLNCVIAMVLVIISVFAYAAMAMAEVECYITLKHANNKNAPVNVRSGPGKDCSIVCKLSAGTKVYYISGNGNSLDSWKKIRVPGYDDEDCYVQNKYLTNQKPSTESDTDQGNANNRYGSTNLKKGSKGSKVRILQGDLKALGHNIAVDGDFGEKTDKAVRSFQRTHGLTADGIVGPKTRLALYKAINNKK